MERPRASNRAVRARELRANQTNVERKLWAALGGRRLHGFKFRRQFPIDRYFADFACFSAKLVVELDGSQHQDRAAYDAERTAIIEACGWRVLRFNNIDVMETLDGVCVAILAALNLAARPPTGENSAKV